MQQPERHGTVSEHKKKLDAIKRRRRFMSMRRFAVAIVLVILGVLLATGFFTPLFGYASQAVDLVRLTLIRGGGFPAPLNLPDVVTATPIGTGAAVAGEQEVILISDSAKQVRRLGHSYADPLLVPGKDRILLYSVGGSEVRVEGYFRNIMTINPGEEVYSAALSDNGNVALAVSDSRYTSAVAVYSTVGVELFRYHLADELPISMSFSRDSRYLAVAGSSAQNGELVTTLYVFSVADRTLVSEIDIGEGLVVGIHFDGTDKIIAVCEEETLLFDTEKGELLQEYSYQGKQLLDVSVKPDTSALALLLGEEQLPSSVKLVTLNSSLSVIGDINPSFDIDNMHYSLYNLTVTSQNRVVQYNDRLQTDEEKDIYLGESLTFLLDNGIALGTEFIYNLEEY